MLNTNLKEIAKNYRQLLLKLLPLVAKRYNILSAKTFGFTVSEFLLFRSDYFLSKDKLATPSIFL